MQQHNKSQKRRKARLFITYVIMTIAVAVISVISILLVLGYRLDVSKGDVEQGALLQFRSFPTDASIKYDGKQLAFATPGKRTVDAGRHTVTYEKDGYHPWTKQFNVKPSELLWLNYARLVPVAPKITDVKSYPVISAMLPSPDRKWLLLQHQPESAEFTLVDIRNNESPDMQQVVLPSESYSKQAGVTGVFTLLEWDFGARYALIKHTLADKVEYLRIDRTDPAATVNISAKLGITISDIHFSGTNGNVFYALDQGNIRRLDSATGTISQPIVKDVVSFELYKSDVLAFTQRANEQFAVGTVVDNRTKIAARYDVTQPIFIDISSYFNDIYLAVGRGTNVEIFINPESSTDRKKITSVTTAASLAWVKFANSGRFVTAGSGTQFVTRDLETRATYTVNLPGTSTTPTNPLQWLDDYNVISTADNEVRMSEFDGANQHVLGSALSGIAVSLTNDGKLLYRVTKHPDGTYVLQTTQMVTRL